MKRLQYLGVVTVCVLLLQLPGCKKKEARPVKKSEHSFTLKGSVRQMFIMPEEPEFPEGEGKKEFIANCGICHSLRYISMQPAFPRKIWDAEIHKMIVKYKAPVDSLVAVKIADYLTKIKGA
ncbi:MAG: hypothetical protein H7257_11950 [Taibaiella sp.]|nr:hypothetical protein [Taibaiella sp.]